jgi:hypothetical protein
VVLSHLFGGSRPRVAEFCYELRPRFGFRPWLAFFFRARWVAFFVRFDMRERG